MKKTGKMLALFLLGICFSATGCYSPVTTKIGQKKSANNYILDLGHKNGGQVTVNLALPKPNPSVNFKTKAINDGISGQLDNVHHIKLILNNDHSSIEDTFTNTPIGEIIIPGPIGSSTDVTFKGLQAGITYYIAARAYAPAFTVNSTTVIINSTNSTNTVYADSPANFDKLALNHGDIVNIDGIDGHDFTVDTIPTSPDITSFTVYPDINTYVSDGTYSLNLQRNLTSLGSDTDFGGGTQGTGENITVQPDAGLIINNDGTPGGSGPNGMWDLVLQLQRNIEAEVTGNLTVTEGIDTTGAPSVTLLP